MPPAAVGPWQLRQLVTPWWVPVTEYTRVVARGRVALRARRRGRYVVCGLGVTGLVAWKVGVVVWQPLQSPLVGWFLSSVASGRESPAAVAVLAIIPT